MRSVATRRERTDDQGIAAWDQHDPDGFVALFADGFVWLDSTLPEPMRTRDEARQYVQAWLTAFPNMPISRTNRVVSEDAVAPELEFTGTNSGPMMAGTETVRVENGKVVEFSSHPDVAEMMMQLGLMPQG